MKSLRILYIGDPAAIHVQRWLHYFVQAGHSVHFIPYPDSFASTPVGTFDGIKVHSFKNNILKSWNPFYKKYLITKSLFLGRKVLNEHSIALIHSHYVSACGWIGAVLNFHPFVLTAWGSDINVDLQRNFFYYKFSNFAIQKADLITANSKDLLARISALGVQQSKLHLIQGGLELDRFPLQRGNEILKQELGLTNKLIVLSTRLLGKVYNLDILIRAIPLVLKVIPNIKFLFIYRGTQEQEKDFKLLIDEVGANNAVVLIGAVDNFRIAGYYHLADIFVSITSSEGMPGSLTEAMACGAVPIVSDLPVFRDWITPEVNGLIVPVRDIQATADAIIKLLRNPENLAFMAQKNRELVLEKFDYRNWMKQMELMYYQLIDKKI